MKNFLIILFCLFYAQNAYCDNPPTGKDIYNQYASGKLNLQTAQALCHRLIEYAETNNFNIDVVSENGNIRTPVITDCDSNDLDYVVKVAYIVAEKVHDILKKQSSNTSDSSECRKSIKERYAYKCGVLEKNNYKNLGYDISNTGMITDCSSTDDRCVVNRPATKNGQSLFYSACCFIPVKNCDSQTFGTRNHSTESSSGILGNTSFLWHGITDRSLTLDDFGTDCEPLWE